MATFTTRLNATKPASSENVSVTVLNDNFDLFDAAVGSTVGTSASRPASAFSGRLYYATDSAKLYVNSASSASAVASWQDSVANALSGAVSIGGDVAASGAINDARSASASNAYTATVYADSQKRYAVTAGGVVNWGSGASAADTNLYRSAANVLRTDDTLMAAAVTSIGTLAASTAATVGTSLTVGSGLTVTEGKGQKTLVRKSTSTGRASVTTVSDDPHITFSLAASAVYQLTAYVTATGATGGDVKLVWNASAPASAVEAFSRGCRGPSIPVTDIADTNMRTDRRTWSTEIGYGVDGALTSHITEEGLVDNSAGGAGTFTLQWAQNASNATSTVLSTGTYAILERLV